MKRAILCLLNFLLQLKKLQWKGSVIYAGSWATDKVCEVYFNMLVVTIDALKMLESNVLGVFQLLNPLLDPTTVDSWKLII